MGKKVGKRGEKGERCAKVAEIRLFTSTQMSLNSPLSWTLIAVQKNGKLTAGLTAGLSAGLTAGLTAVLTGIIVVILRVPY